MIRISPAEKKSAYRRPRLVLKSKFEDVQRTARMMTVDRAPALPLAGLRVVIVDDDRVSLMAITAMVGSWGAQIRHAASGDDALRLILEEPPDLLLSDLYMPGMDGFALMKRVRELPAGQGGRIPGIAITAHPSFDSRRDAQRAGFGAVFSKPFARDELIDTILYLAKQ